MSSTALVRYQTNDYSVPTAYRSRDVVVKGFVDEVVISCAGEEIARHARCCSEGVFVANPVHHLAIIETKPGARPGGSLTGREPTGHLPAPCHLLEARISNKGKREFI